MKRTHWGMIMSVGIAASLLPIACGSSRDTVAKPTIATGDASDGLLRRDDSTEIPCEPRRVLVAICQQCHTRPETKNGAPFPLQWRSDVLATYGGVEIRQLMIEQLSVGRMPLAPVSIGPNDRELLLSWLQAGASRVEPTACIESGTGDAATTPSIGNDAGEDAGDDAGGSLDASDPDAGADGDVEESQ
jgi:hypothetical protein